jgi:hypothetical protein
MEGLARRHLQAANEALKSLDDLATPQGVSLAGEVVSRYLSVAMDELRGVDQQLPAIGLQAQTDFVRVPCSFCGKPLMPTATLCGFCWRRRDPLPLVAAAVSPTESSSR